MQLNLIFTFYMDQSQHKTNCKTSSCILHTNTKLLTITYQATYRINFLQVSSPFYKCSMLPGQLQVPHCFLSFFQKLDRQHFRKLTHPILGKKLQHCTTENNIILDIVIKASERSSEVTSNYLISLSVGSDHYEATSPAQIKLGP